MARLKRPLNRAAAAAADDALYANHPELVQNGQRRPIGNDATLRQEWTEHYLANGGELDVEGGGRRSTAKRWLKDEPARFRAERRGPAVKAPPAHVFYTTTAALLIRPNWPLRGYYVYVDTDATSGVRFAVGSPWWTDENGIPHEVDDEGRPIRPVPVFAFAWSPPEPGATPVFSLAVLYDRDRDRLERRRREFERTLRSGPLPREYELRPTIWLKPEGTSFTLQVYVPEQREVLDLRALDALRQECDGLRRELELARRRIDEHITGSILHQVCFFHRAQVEAWLSAFPRRRGHLSRIQTGPNKGKSYWWLACDTFDRVLVQLTGRYLDGAGRLMELLRDARKMELLGQIDLVDSLADETGDHELWRHEFLCAAYGFLANTPYADEALERFLQPLLRALSELWERQRVGCGCATCAAMTAEVTVDRARHGADLDRLGWRAKDLKNGTRTAQRLIDLMTKFKDSIGKALARSTDLAADAQFYAFLFMLRTGGFGDRPQLIKAYDRWINFWGRYYDAARKGSGTLDTWARQLDAEYAALGLKSPGGRDWLKSISSAAGLIGAAITFYDIFSRESHRWNVKTTLDVSKASIELIQGTIGVVEGLTPGGMKGLLMARGMSEPAAKACAERLSHWTRVAGAGGGAILVAGSYLTLRDAADKGDGREFGWAAVQYSGASIAMAGLTLDATVAGSAGGVILNVVGGAVYLVGSAGEWFTRPGEVERFLRNEGYWSEREEWNDEDRAELERFEAELRRRAAEDRMYRPSQKL